MRQFFGHERFEHPESVALINEQYANEWSHVRQPLQAGHQAAQTKQTQKQNGAGLRADTTDAISTATEQP